MSSFLMEQHPRSSILEIYSNRDSIQLFPVYQRISGVWDIRKRRLLIDSIVNGVDLPKIYFHELNPPIFDNSGNAFRYAVVDGKQRLESIFEFLEGRLRLPSTFRLFEDLRVNGGGLDYDGLGREYPRLRSRFDNTKLPIVVVKTDDTELIEELFSRLNEAAVLTAPEYRNTLGGPLPRMFREMSTHPFFVESLPFETERHKYLDLAAKFAYLCQEKAFQSTKKVMLDRFVREYPRSPEDASMLRKEVEGILAEMHIFFEQKDKLLDSIGWVTLLFHVFRLQGQHSIGFSRQAIQEFVGAVAATRRKIRQISQGEYQGSLTDREQMLAQFDSSRQSLNDGTALRERYQLMRRDIDEQRGIVLPDPVGGS